jgi:hypothetical protein
MCRYHYCAIVYDITALTHSILTCSGAILNFQGSKFFNPINVYTPMLEDMKPYPNSMIDFFGNQFQYYYIKDSRSSFAENIISVNCTNDFTTCIQFEGGKSFCMGNVQDIRVLHPLSSFVLGTIVAMFFVTIVYISLSHLINYFRNVVATTLYIVPIVGMSLVINAVFAIHTAAYVIGIFLVLVLVPLISSFIELIFEKYIII